MQSARETSFLLILASVMLFLLMFLSISPSDKGLVNPFSLTPTREVTIVFGGDVMLGRSVMTKSHEVGDSRYPFLKVADRLSSSDITFVNLENPITEGCPDHIDGLTFCATPDMLEGLTYSGVDIVSIANNHTNNWGKEGYEETKKHLTDSGIEFVGDGNMVVRTIGGTKYGFLGFNLVDNPLKEEYLELIKDSDSEVDVLIVGVHWGQEYKSEAGAFQKESAEAVSRAGADIIIGHHPHWVQNSETINNSLIYYSLGNLVFDQMWSEETKKGLLLELTFNGSSLIQKRKIKTYMEKWAQPQLTE